MLYVGVVTETTNNPSNALVNTLLAGTQLTPLADAEPLSVLNAKARLQRCADAIRGVDRISVFVKGRYLCEAKNVIKLVKGARWLEWLSCEFGRWTMRNVLMPKLKIRRPVASRIPALVVIVLIHGMAPLRMKPTGKRFSTGTDRPGRALTSRGDGDRAGSAYGRASRARNTHAPSTS